MVPHVIHTLCLRVRAIAVYKSVARCPSLFSFICLKYIYSWLIACYCTCSYGWIDIFPSRRAACKRRRAATWQGRWGPCGPYSRPCYLRPVSAGPICHARSRLKLGRGGERERERGIHGARWPPAAGDPVSPLVLLLRSSIPCVGW